MEALMQYSWPGNVRELRNVVEFSAYMSVNDEITVMSLPEQIRRYTETLDPENAPTLAFRIKKFEQEEIRRQILAQAQKLVEQGIEKTEFERLRRSALGRRIRGLDSFDATCFRLCAYRFTNYDYFNFPEVYRSIRWEDVVSFLKRTVLEEHCALSVIFPKH
jgi:predicted Zn-dependent peptidase